MPNVPKYIVVIYDEFGLIDVTEIESKETALSFANDINNGYNDTYFNCYARVAEVIK